MEKTIEDSFFCPQPELPDEPVDEMEQVEQVEQPAKSEQHEVEADIAIKGRETASSYIVADLEATLNQGLNEFYESCAHYEKEEPEIQLMVFQRVSNRVRTNLKAYLNKKAEAAKLPHLAKEPNS